MITVPAIQEGEVIVPAEPLANFPTVIRWACDGKEYLGFEEGEEQPPLPNTDPQP